MKKKKSIIMVITDKHKPKKLIKLADDIFIDEDLYKKQYQALKDFFNKKIK